MNHILRESMHKNLIAFFLQLQIACQTQVAPSEPQTARTFIVLPTSLLPHAYERGGDEWLNPFASLSSN